MTMFELDTFRRKVNFSGHSFYAIYVNSLEVDNNYYYLLSIIYYLLYYYLLSIIYYLIGNVVIYVPIDVYSIVLVLYQDQSMNQKLSLSNLNESWVTNKIIIFTVLEQEKCWKHQNALSPSQLLFQNEHLEFQENWLNNTSLIL